MATDTRTRMLEQTARLLQHRGYHRTSLNDILAASAAPRGSLYFHFPGGKEQLALEATKIAIQETTDALRASLAAARTPAKGVRAFFEEAAGLMVQSEYTFGCPVAPVILDAAGGVPELAEICRAAFEEWVRLLEDAFKDAGIPRARARALALLAEAALEGLLLISRAYQDTKEFLVVAKELEAIVESATPRPTGNGARRRSRA